MTLARGGRKTERPWKRRLIQPLLGLSPRGMSPEAMALSVAVGFALGVFPLPGCPTLLCALAAVLLRLNAPAVQAVNYLVYPLQLALFAPFVRMGGRLFRFPALAHAGAWRAVLGVFGAVAHALAGWLCIAAPAGLLVYLLLACCLRRIHCLTARRRAGLRTAMPGIPAGILPHEP